MQGARLEPRRLVFCIRAAAVLRSRLGARRYTVRRERDAVVALPALLPPSTSH